MGYFTLLSKYWESGTSQDDLKPSLLTEIEMESAANRVFGIYELVEQILLGLSVPHEAPEIYYALAEHLFLLQSVNKMF